MLKLSRLDRLIVNFDQGLRTIFGQPLTSARPNPAQHIDYAELTPTEKKLTARLMRVNHAGEVAAQALYQGQALTARNETIYATLQQSAREENDHLVWCKMRVKECGGHVSFLDPFWYAGSFTIGALAGIAGDKWSLGFVIETERQVITHLDKHLQRLPERDEPSRAILLQMQLDEAHHATVALGAGGVPLPMPVRWIMKGTAKVMTNMAFWI
ncbi:MAG: demethoxyubiquinone hydroxylase family protein [Beggiatoa sp. IS2]|nr:MAG: demethoxyubiquinone hydroxylase family protein [Beggiatoa sp. IS2]